MDQARPLPAVTGGGVSPAQSVPIRLVSVAMGYGHLRAAHALADELGTQVWHADAPPLADAAEIKTWQRARSLYEFISRASQLSNFGGPMRSILEGFTSIPHLHPYRDLSGQTLGTRGLARFMRRGMGKGLVKALRAEPAALLTTFYAPAIIADAAGCLPAYCVVTDADINRIWTPPDTRHSEIIYFVPSLRAKTRLQSYGVRPEKIHYTGFPLPRELLGGPDLGALRKNLAHRLLRLDPSGTFRDSFRDELDHFLGDLPAAPAAPPLLTFTVGGAGSQGDLGRLLLESLRSDIAAGKIRLALVPGTHGKLAEEYLEQVKRLGLEGQLDHGLRIVSSPDVESYFPTFNALLAETDILLTKPSEMTFFAALGLPLVFSWPVGVHERYNRRWAIEGGAGLKQRDPRFASEWINEWLQDGTLAGAAWSGFMRLPKFGLYRILEHVRDGGAASTTT